MPPNRIKPNQIKLTLCQSYHFGGVGLKNKKITLVLLMRVHQTLNTSVIQIIRLSILFDSSPKLFYVPTPATKKKKKIADKKNDYDVCVSDDIHGCQMLRFFLHSDVLFSTKQRFTDVEVLPINK